MGDSYLVRCALGLGGIALGWGMTYAVMQGRLVEARNEFGERSYDALGARQRSDECFAELTAARRVAEAAVEHQCEDGVVLLRSETCAPEEFSRCDLLDAWKGGLFRPPGTDAGSCIPARYERERVLTVQPKPPVARRAKPVGRRYCFQFGTEQKCFDAIDECSYQQSHLSLSHLAGSVADKPGPCRSID